MQLDGLLSVGFVRKGTSVVEVVFAVDGMPGESVRVKIPKADGIRLARLVDATNGEEEAEGGEGDGRKAAC